MLLRDSPVIIGDCTLYLGDCRDVLPMLGKVDSIITDPPYGMNYQSSKRTDKHDKIRFDDSEELLIYSCNIDVLHSKYIFCRWDNLISVPKPKSCITWIKNNWTSGDLDHSHGRQTENILFYKGLNHHFPKFRPSDVIDGRKALNDIHPSEKPVDLIRSIVEWTAGIVVDPFMGSGTTGVACVKMGRKFIGIELEQKYFEISCRRIEEAYRQSDMFIAQPKKPEQLILEAAQ